MLSATLLAFVSSAAVVSGKTVAQLLATPPAWQVMTGSASQPVCSQASCCCFVGNVNVFIDPAKYEVYFNGTVAGKGCDEPIKQDNIDPPSGYNFQQEFFGIDDYDFTLAQNSVVGYGQGWTLSALASPESGRSECSFGLFAATQEQLPVTPDPNPAPAVIPTYAKPFLGEWNFDTTACAVNDPDCCCLLGSGANAAKVIEGKNGAASFYIKGIPSQGCNTILPYEQDDFPFPSPVSPNSVPVNGFLAKQDNYVITLGQGSGGAQYSLSFQDLTQPKCSMLAQSVAQNPTPAPSSGGSGGWVAFGVIVALGAVGGAGYWWWTRKRAQGASFLSSSSSSSSSSSEYPSLLASPAVTPSNQIAAV